MNALRQQTNLSPWIFWNLFLSLAGYRLEMPVTEVVVFPSAYGKTGYYRCPRCRITMDREFMSFCDRCGQHLSWKHYKKAKVLYPGQHDPVHI